MISASARFILEFLQSHTNVVYQPPYNSKWYSSITPSALGFNMWRDLKRVCEDPTDEDRLWFPEVAGSDWRATFDFAMQNFKDESFIAQFLSPRLMRQFRLFTIIDDAREARLRIGEIHNEAGYRALRLSLADQYNLGSREPTIQVWNVDLMGDRTLTLRHFNPLDRPLARDSEAVLGHLAFLWGFTVRLEEVDGHGAVRLLGLRTGERRKKGR